MSKPKAGTRGVYQVDDRAPVGFSIRGIEGNLCYADYDDGTTGPFIWRFKDGLNSCHDWLGKDGKDEERHT